MSRTEQIETIARSLYNPTIDAERGKINAFIEGAKWSDMNPVVQEFKIASESYHCSKLVDWQTVRIQAAIAAMKGICSNPSSFATMSNQLIAEESIDIADALVIELKGE